MQRSDSVEDIVCGYRTVRLGPHPDDNGNHLVFQPPLHSDITLLESSKPCTDDFAAGGVGPGGDECVDIIRLLRGQAEGSLLSSGHRFTRNEGESMKPALLALLSFNGGYVDTAGFLALHGLFTTHVTGNFVTFGAALALGTSGVLAKLLALPLFCVVVFAVRLLGVALQRRNRPALRTMIVLQMILLALGAALAVRFGPFPDGDAWPALATGGALISAMAIQNAFHRIHLASAPPTTIMTGTTTQIMIDLADLFRGVTPEAKAAARTRLGPMAASVAVFASGCAAAALLYVLVKEWCFVAPPVIAFVALLLKVAPPPAKPA